MKCGDGVCSPEENCSSCVDDCAACPACAAAPSCTGAPGVPASPEPRDDLDRGVDHPVPDMAGLDMAGSDGGAPAAKSRVGRGLVPSAVALPAGESDQLAF